MTFNQSQNPTWPHDSIIHAYWVVPGRLLAGEYPGSIDPDEAARKRQVLLGAGVNSFVNLTKADELAGGGHPLKPYDKLLIAEAEDRGLEVTHTRFEIPDTYIIDDAGYDEILTHIRNELDSGKVVLAHCWGGKGRTGTVVGAWLIENEGLDYYGAIHRMRDLRRGTKKAHHPVPDTEAQHEVLRQRAQRKVA
jgi:hypothetical protein